MAISVSVTVTRVDEAAGIRHGGVERGHSRGASIFGPVRDAPTETVRRIERAYAQAAARPRPAVLARIVTVT